MKSTLEKLRKRDLYDGYEYYYKLKSLIKSSNGRHDIRSLPEYKLLATVNPHLAEALAIENDIVNLKFSMNGSYGDNDLDVDVLRDRVKLQTQIRKLKLKRNMELNKAKARWDYISTMHAWRRRRVKEVIEETPKKLANKLINKVNNVIAGLIAMGIEKTSVPRRIESIVKDEMEKMLQDLKEGES